MGETMNEKDKFFEDLKEEKKGYDIFGDSKSTPEVPAKEKEKEEEVVPESIKNRRHRRLEQSLERERESNIALNERVKVLTEMKETAKSTNVDERLYRLYGMEESGKQAAALTQSLLDDMAAKAEERALDKFRAEQESARKEVSKQESVLDGFLETVEDEFNVDLTSNAPAARKARAGFFEALKDLSPKDGETVTAFADPLATWEHYQLKQNQSKSPENNERQKELASRSMTRSGASAPQAAPQRMNWNEVNKIFGKLTK